jgi:hypothetical protein
MDAYKDIGAPEIAMHNLPRVKVPHALGNVQRDAQAEVQRQVARLRVILDVIVQIACTAIRYHFRPRLSVREMMTRYRAAQTPSPNWPSAAT